MRINIEGTLLIEKHIHIRGGGILLVGKHGVLSIGQDTLINCYTRVWCVKRIIIGRNSRESWESQIFDSNFHYVVDEKGMTKNCSGKIVIDNNVWIGNRCTINKGTILPDFTIVGSSSFVNRDFSKYGERSIVGGMPAKFIKTGYLRLFDYKTQIIIDNYFINNPDQSEYIIKGNII